MRQSIRGWCGSNWIVIQTPRLQVMSANQPLGQVGLLTGFDLGPTKTLRLFSDCHRESRELLAISFGYFSGDRAGMVDRVLKPTLAQPKRQIKASLILNCRCCQHQSSQIGETLKPVLVQTLTV